MQLRRLVFVLATLVSACAAQGPSIKDGESVSIASAPSLKGRLPEIEISNSAIGKDAAVGSKGGVLVGALTALGCGPLAIICLGPAMLAGGAAGAAVGVGVGVAQGLPAETKDQLLLRIEAFSRAHDPHEQLLANVTQRAKTYWIVIPKAHSVTDVEVRLDRISLRSNRDGRVALVLEGRVKIQRAGEPQNQDENSFVYEGPASDAGLWVEEPSDFVAETFRQGYANIAWDVVNRLRSPTSR